MGKVNVKLMQGIAEAEEQVARDREVQEIHAGEEDKNREVSEKSIDKVKPDSDAQKESITESLKKQRMPKERSMAVNEEGRDTKKSGKKQVFSFRADVNAINVWKAYSTASGMTMENIGTAAMNEYMRRHRLSGIEQAVFEALCAKAVDMRSGI